MTTSTAASLASTPLDRLLGDLETSRAGLTEADAVARLKRCGPNDALAHEGHPLAVQFLVRFLNPLVLILLFASALSALAGDTASFVIVVVIVTLSVILDFVQEVRAQNAVDALRRSVAPKALVVRDGRERELHFEELVPGDVVKLCAGDVVPADARLIAARDIFVNQALLTGEPYPAEKHARDLTGEIAQPDEETNLVFMGTSVVSGTATAVACRTGKETRIGGLATQLAHRRPPDAFEIGVRRFGFLILRVTFFLVLFVLATNVLFQRPWLELIMFSLALAVGLTPELLPMVVTVTLARGALRLAGLGVIAKRLPAIHDLGAMDTLCTDKTGTLTEAKIRLVRHVDSNGTECPKVRRLAYLNSAFETGIRSPLDDASLAPAKPDAGECRPSSTRCRSTSSAAVSLSCCRKSGPPSGCSSSRERRGRAQAFDAAAVGRRRHNAVGCGFARGRRRGVHQARRGRLPRARHRLPPRRPRAGDRRRWRRGRSYFCGVRRLSRPAERERLQGDC